MLYKKKTVHKRRSKAVLFEKKVEYKTGKW
jgi:hypothetical protein